MDRRDFIKVSGAAAAGLALTGCGPKAGRAGTADSASKPLDKVETPDFSGRISREVEIFKPLNIKEITIEAGAAEPFDVMHVSDTHLTWTDDRNDERKAWFEVWLGRNADEKIDGGRVFVNGGNI